MHEGQNLSAALESLNARLASIEEKLDGALRHRNKSLDWIAQISRQVEAMGDFRQEVRQTFEPIALKLEALDDLMRIMRHAQSDVSRRITELEAGGEGRRAG